MRLPSKGILIRLCIYVPVLGYLSWKAIERYRGDAQPAATEQSDLDAKLAPHKRIITLPDGSQQEIVELTPEQAEAILGPMPQLDDADAKAKAEPR